MCMYLVNGNVLGKRLVSYEVYESRTKGFTGYSEKQIMDRLKHGEKIYGFKIAKGAEGDTLELDESFHMVNVQLKSGVNTLSFLKEMTECDINTELIVVAAFTDSGKRVYETVNARHARVAYSEGKLRMMMELGVPVAGVWMSKGKLTICEGVEDLDKKGGVTDE